MASKRPRLSRSSDFQRIYRQGTSTASRFLVLYSFKRPPEAGAEGPRLGLSVSKKLGGAVVRNRVKRLLREAVQACAGRLAEEYDLVVIARPQLLDLIARENAGEKGLVGDALRELMVRAGVLREATEALKQVPGAVLIAFIKVYQYTISPLLGPRCKYYPSCSNYAIGALREHGAFRGAGLAVWRIMRCNPFSNGGYDPCRRAAGNAGTTIPRRT